MGHQHGVKRVHQKRTRPTDYFAMLVFLEKKPMPIQLCATRALVDMFRQMGVVFYALVEHFLAATVCFVMRAQLASLLKE